jgi:hypothetical protein
MPIPFQLPRAAWLLLVVLLAGGFGSGERWFAPDARAWARWAAHDDASGRRIEAGGWDALLRRHVRPVAGGANRVRYRAFTAADRKQLDGFLAASARAEISRYPRSEQLAFWINLYNALTVKVVLDHYPVDSIRDIDTSPGLFSNGPWGAKLIRVEGEALSLDDIEHRILRPLWKDNRVHYAINCASIGCPDLQPFAFRGDRIDAQLDAAARGYVNDPRGVSVSGRKITVSRIYDWFIDDFGGSEAGVVAHLLRHAEPALARRIRAIGRLDGTAYDWRLNGG